MTWSILDFEVSEFTLCEEPKREKRKTVARPRRDTEGSGSRMSRIRRLVHGETVRVITGSVKKKKKRHDKTTQEFCAQK